MRQFLSLGGDFINKSSRYDYDISIAKDYNGRIKLSTHKVLRRKGFEGVWKSSPKGSKNDEKLLSNLVRTKSTIYELAMCNEWDFFCTFTLNPEKYDRFDLSKFRSDFTLMIRHLRTKYQCNIAYLLIPERHKDGAWHMHGFIRGLPLSELRDFTLGEKLPRYITNKIKDGSKVYEWVTYRKKFGFCDLEKIRDKNRCSSYVTKYITKDLLDSVKELNHKTYYCSQGLKRAEEIKRGHLVECPTYDFSNDYVQVKWFDNDSKDTIIELFENVNELKTSESGGTV